MKLKDELFFQEKLEEFRDNYKKVLLSEQEYFIQFSNMMDKILQEKT
jgi:hypothetical protein